MSECSRNLLLASERLGRGDRDIATVLDGIRNTHSRPPVQKEAVLPEDLVAMLETLDGGALHGGEEQQCRLQALAHDGDEGHEHDGPGAHLDRRVELGV